METQTQRTNLWTQPGKERAGEVEKVAQTYTHYRVEQMTSGKLPHNTELSLAPGDNLEGRTGWEGG